MKHHTEDEEKIAFDLRKSNYKFTDLVSRLQKYAKIYNRQHHESLDTGPFHVYYGRLPCHGNEAIDVNSPTADLTAPVAKRLKHASNVRATANVISDKYAANNFYGDEAVTQIPAFVLGSWRNSVREKKKGAQN